jgi:hypothetical protein
VYATEQQAAILRAAVAEIKKHPETFDMKVWAGRTYNDSNSPCGTVCCLAGQMVRNATSDAEWSALILQEETTLETPIKDAALNLLGPVRLDTLFIVDFWPMAFRPGVDCQCFEEDDENCMCEIANPTPDQLEARVEWWIKTGK